MYWYFTEKEIIKQYRGLSPPDFFLYAHIIFSNRCKGPGRIPNLEYFYSDIGKSHNKPSRNTFFSLGMRTRAPRAPVTSVIIGWRNWGYICFRCWQLIQTGANSTLLSPFFLFNMVLLTSLQPPPNTHHPPTHPLCFHTNTIHAHKQLHENKINRLHSNTLWTFIYLFLSFSETTNTAYDCTEWKGCLLRAGYHQAGL